MRLEGEDLLDRVGRRSAGPVSEIVRSCGYVHVGRNGEERLDYAGFHMALLLAEGRGEALLSAGDQGAEMMEEAPCAEVLVDGFLALARPEGFSAGELGMYGLQLGEWDLYYPGTPLRLYAIDQEMPDRSFRSVFESPGEGDLLIASDVLERGQRYVLELSEGMNSDPPFLMLEPYPWNGIDADDRENMRLLVIPKNDVNGLLALAASYMAGQLYDDACHEDLEEALGEALESAVRGFVSGDEPAQAVCSRFGIPLDLSWLIERLKRLWLEPLEFEFKGLQGLRGVLISCLHQLERGSL